MKTILVVEDNSTTLAGMLVLLGAKGYAVQGAKDATEAEDIIEDIMPDIILADYYLNGTDGLMLGEKVREMPNGHKPRLVLMTASDSACIDPLRGRLGAIHMEVLIKPFETDNLYEMLTRLSSEGGKIG